MSPFLKYASFLLRLWHRPGKPGGHMPDCWQSEIEHIQSGKTWSFATLEELDIFLHQQTNDPMQFDWIEVQENEP